MSLDQRITRESARFAQGRRDGLGALTVNVRDYYSSYESISGYRGPRQPGYMHPVTHTKNRSTLLPVQNLGPANSDPWESVVNGKYPISAGASPDGGCYVYCNAMVELSALEKRELTKLMCGDIPTLVSVPNMILEIPQTLTLWSDLRDPLLRALDLSTKKNTGLRRRAKHGANSLLSQQFGLLPLIGDLTTLMTSAKTVHSEVKRITALPKEWASSSKALPLSYLKNIVHLSPGQIQAQLADVSVHATATVHYKHRLSRVLPPPAELARQVSRDLFGFSNPLEVLWEATPFSFVADWFYPVGDYLSELNRSELTGSMQIKDICTCVSVEARGTVEVIYVSGPPQPASAFVCKQFKRTLGLPSSTSSLDDLMIPGLRQSVLGGALLLQKYA